MNKFTAVIALVLVVIFAVFCGVVMHQNKHHPMNIRTNDYHCENRTQKCDYALYQQYKD